MKWEDQQAIKTVIKRHAKLQPCSIEMDRAVELDTRAETGESQADMLGQFGDSPGALPSQADLAESEEGDEKDLQPHVDKFDLKIRERDDIDPRQLNKYFQGIINKYWDERHEAITVEEIKADAIKNFDAFLQYYQVWLKGEEQAPEPQEEESQEPPEPSAQQKPQKDDDDWTNNRLYKEAAPRRKGDDKNQTGFRSWILQNAEEIRKADDRIDNYLRGKFRKLYGKDAVYPLDEVQQEPSNLAEDPEYLIYCEHKDVMYDVRWCAKHCPPKYRNPCDEFKHWVVAHPDVDLEKI